MGCCMSTKNRKQLKLTAYQQMILDQIDRYGYAPDFGETSDWQALMEAGLVRPAIIHHSMGLKWDEPAYIRVTNEVTA